MKVVVFGHDADDAILRTRIQSFQRLGYEVTAYTFRRGAPRPREWDNIDLGQTYDARHLHRAGAVARAILQTNGKTDPIREADLLWARNLEMLTIATAHRRGNAPLIYETTDIHPKLTSGALAPALRTIEAKCLRKAAGIVITSPGFDQHYYSVHHNNIPDRYLLENTLILEDLPPRQGTDRPIISKGVLKVGWVGNLRCQRSLDLLLAAADHFDGAVEIHAHGKPAPTQVPNFDAQVGSAPHFHYHGPYQAPEDLGEIYNGLDLVWAGDFYQSPGNSDWLLPCRLYEGGYYGVPSIAPAGTQLAEWIDTNRLGTVIPAPFEQGLIDSLDLMRMGSALSDLRQRVAGAPVKLFARPTSELGSIIDRAVAA